MGFDVTAFVSGRKIDATLNKQDNTITSIVTSGYHRTQTEMAKKNNASQFVGGGNLQFRSNGFNIGMTALYTSLDKPIKPNTNQKYRKYYASGKEFWNMSVNYGYTASRWSLSGETATGNCHAIASINKLSYEPVHELTLTAIQRFYSYKYHALFAESFNDGGYVQNYGYVIETENYRYCLRCNPSPGDYNAYLTAFDLNVQRQNMARKEKPLVGRVTFVNGDTQEFTDAEAYLRCIEDELPDRPITGFRYETLTDDPAVRKGVDDILFNLFGEENPRPLEKYETPDQGMKMGGM